MMMVTCLLGFALLVALENNNNPPEKWTLFSKVNCS